MAQRQNSLAGRAGAYRRQPAGYSAFIPAPLPPDPPIRMDGELQSLLSQADRALGRLDGSIQILPHPDLFVLMYVRKEAVLSSQIEGTQSSLQDLLAAEARVFAPGRPNDVGELVNYVGAMNYGLERLSQLPVSVRLIRDIHARLLQGTRGAHLMPGALRTSQNWIGPSGFGLNDAVFVPPPPHEVPPALAQLERFLHEETGLPPLVEIALVHAQFETVHPFLDGNGRIGRLLIVFLLCQRNILQKPILYLSHFFRRNQQQYYQELQSIRDAGSWERWLAFFLRGVIEVSAEATDMVRHILALREEHRHIIAERLGRAAGNGHRVLEHLYQHPIVSVDDIQAVIGATYPAANTLAARMVACGILQEFTGRRRHRRFVYRRYVDLFHGADAAP